MSSVSGVHIDDLDTTSPDEVRRFWEVEQSAQRADRREPALRTLSEFTKAVTVPSDYYARAWLLARQGNVVVGVAELTASRHDNPHLATFEINVVPGARRRGVGRALHAELVRRARSAGRTHLYGEALAPDEQGSAATAFATSLGGRPAHTEHHLVLDLPVALDVAATWGGPDPAYEVLTWEGRCPDELRTAYVDLRSRMEQDVPTGDIAYDPVTYDEERLQSEEERKASTMITMVAVARDRASGDLVGYSFLLLPREDDHEVFQEDTLVIDAHRGHRLGLALKQANLVALAERHPSRSRVHTWTAPDNTAMYRTNQRMGYRTVEVMYEMEFRLD